MQGHPLRSASKLDGKRPQAHQLRERFQIAHSASTEVERQLRQIAQLRERPQIAQLARAEVKCQFF